MTKISIDPITLKNMLDNYGVWDQTKFQQGQNDTYYLIKKTPVCERISLVRRKMTSCLDRIQHGNCRKAQDLAYWLGCLVKLDEFDHMYSSTCK